MLPGCAPADTSRHLLPGTKALADGMPWQRIMKRSYLFGRLPKTFLNDQDLNRAVCQQNPKCYGPWKWRGGRLVGFSIGRDQKTIQVSGVLEFKDDEIGNPPRRGEIWAKG